MGSDGIKGFDGVMLSKKSVGASTSTYTNSGGSTTIGAGAPLTSVTSAQLFQTCAVSSASQRQLSTYSPGGRSRGTRTWSEITPVTQSEEHSPMPSPSHLCS